MVLSVSTADAWRASPLPAVIVPEVIGADLAAEARASLEVRGYTRYALVDRGSYDFIDAPQLPQVVEALVGIASAVTGRTLSLTSARALRFGPGDYLLVRGDRVHDDRPVEVVLDLSVTTVPDTEVHYRHRGQVFFTFPSEPGALAIVERGPTVMANHTYVSRRHVAASVVRLVVVLQTTP